MKNYYSEVMKNKVGKMQFMSILFIVSSNCTKIFHRTVT